MTLCPNGADHEPLHPDGWFCHACTRRLPQAHRRAIARANRGETDRTEVLQRCVRWFDSHRGGTTPRPGLRYSTG